MTGAFLSREGLQCQFEQGVTVRLVSGREQQKEQWRGQPVQGAGARRTWTCPGC